MCAALISQFFFFVWTKTTNIFRLRAVAGSLIKFLLLLIFDVVLFVSSHDVIFLKQHHKKKGCG